MRAARLLQAVLSQLCAQVMEEQLARRGEAAVALKPALSRMLADVQHRLTFRAQAFIKVRASSIDLQLPQVPAPSRQRKAACWQTCSTVSPLAHRPSSRCDRGLACSSIQRWCTANLERCCRNKQQPDK